MAEYFQEILLFFFTSNHKNHIELDIMEFEGKKGKSSDYFKLSLNGIFFQVEWEKLNVRMPSDQIKLYVCLNYKQFLY